MNNSIKTILFDLDGTLIDNFTAIHKSHNHIQKHFGLPELDFETVKSTVGGALPVSLERLSGPQYVDEAQPIFRKYYETVMLENAKLLPGTEWLLKSLHLQGFNMAVFTNKPGKYARQLCQHLGIDPYFTLILGELDTPYRKPQPEFTTTILERLNSCPNTTAMIGDSPFDIDAAACVSMPVHTVTTGSHTADELHAHDNPPTTVHSSLYLLGQSVFGLREPLLTTT